MATEPTTHRPNAPAGRSLGPVTRVLDLFSSVRLGIVLMVILFVYCSIGSAGIVYPELGPGRWNIFDGDNWRHAMMRQWRPFELTEFQWFHTWLFNGLIALICLNITVTTVRRIRLSAINLGVWMIHSGILILCAGSVIYFSTKIEGDTPVYRRKVVVQAPGGPKAELLATPGSSATVSTPAGDYQFRVSQVDPNWRLRSGPDEGKSTFAVSVAINTPKTMFVRQLLAGYPEFTEDVIPGKGRVKKIEEFGGRALVDDTLTLSLEHAPQDSFWLKDSTALYARTVGSARWSQRRLVGVPRYNDYVADPAADLLPGPETPEPALLSVPAVPPSENPGPEDPLADAVVRVTGFLRYAVMLRGMEAGAPTDALNPYASVRIEEPESGRRWEEELLALDARASSRFNDMLRFVWVKSREELDALDAPLKPRQLTIRVPRPQGVFELVIPLTRESLEAAQAQPMAPVGDTGFSYKIRSLERLPLSEGTTIVVLLVDILTPEGTTLHRWVFEDPARIRDNMETAPEEPHKPQPPDPRIETVYSPGSPDAVFIVAGPPDVGLHLLSGQQGARKRDRITVGSPVQIASGFNLTLTNYIERARPVVKPRIIPRMQRNKDDDAEQRFTLVQVEVASGGRTQRKWIPFSKYIFDGDSQVYGALGGRFEPAVFTLPDGRAIELAVGRERRALPAPVVLDDFVLTANAGGFTGKVSSVRDWTSTLRFLPPAAAGQQSVISEPLSVSTNDPKTFAGLWYFQAYWDAPRPPRDAEDPGSAGLCFTGLGVGNRNGVHIQLFGCVLAVAGMIYAFYVKPMMRARRRERALAAARSHGLDPFSRGVAMPQEVEPVLASANTNGGGGGRS